MGRRQQRNAEVRSAIMNRIAAGNGVRIAAHIAEQFGLSRQAATRHVRTLAQEGHIRPIGNTRNRTYLVAAIPYSLSSFPITATLSEHDVWQAVVGDRLEALPENVQQICFYAISVG
jgi:predicted transcriptional regulator